MTGRIHDRLRAHFRDDDVFQDVLSINYGDNFLNKTNTIIKSSSVFIPIIGKNWLDSTIRRHENGEVDYMRMEIEQALKTEKIIIPALVENAKMPAPDKLPASIRDLYKFHAISIRPNPDFDSDMNRLLNRLDGILDRKKSTGFSPRFWVVTIVGLALVIFAGLKVLDNLQKPIPEQQFEDSDQEVIPQDTVPVERNSKNESKQEKAVAFSKPAQHKPAPSSVQQAENHNIKENKSPDREPERPDLHSSLTGTYKNHETEMSFNADNTVKLVDPDLGNLQGFWTLKEFEYEQNKAEIEIEAKDGQWFRFILLDKDIGQSLKLREVRSRKRFNLNKE